MADKEFDDLDTPVPEEELTGEKPPEVTPEVTPEVEKPAEPAPEAEPEAPEAKAEKPRDQQIPRARFDEVNAKLQAERAAREAAEAKLAAAAAPVADVSALEKEWRTAFLDGDEDKADEIRDKINTEIMRKATEQAYTQIDQKITQRDQERALNDAAKKATTDYPFLDSSSETANAEAIKEVVEWRDFYIARGESWHDALIKAVDKVAPGYKPEPDTTGKVASIDDQRKAKAITRNAKAANAQPPQPASGVGNRAIPETPIPEKQEDWEKLPEAERAKMLS